MRAVVIQIPDDALPEEIGDIVKHVGGMLDDGFREGRVGITELNWSIEDVD